MKLMKFYLLLWNVKFGEKKIFDKVLPMLFSEAISLRTSKEDKKCI